MPESLPVYISPGTTHTHTIILLHDDRSYGQKFGLDILLSKTSNDKTLRSRFPGWRWVFPNGRYALVPIPYARPDTTRFWFEIDNLEDINEEQQRQVPGLRKSVLFLMRLLLDEIDILGGKADHIFLGGVGQGMAVALWTLLCSPVCMENPRLGGFVGFSGYLPFARAVDTALLSLFGKTRRFDDPQAKAEVVSRFLLETIGYDPELDEDELDVKALLATPAILGHHSQDDVVDVAVGRHAYSILEQLEIKVEWKEYDDHDPTFHWIKGPEGFDDIAQFLEQAVKDIGDVENSGTKVEHSAVADEEHCTVKEAEHSPSTLVESTD